MEGSSWKEIQRLERMQLAERMEKIDDEFQLELSKLDNNDFSPPSDIWNEAESTQDAHRPEGTTNVRFSPLRKGISCVDLKQGDSRIVWDENESHSSSRAPVIIPLLKRNAPISISITDMTEDVDAKSSTSEMRPNQIKIFKIIDSNHQRHHHLIKI